AQRHLQVQPDGLHAGRQGHRQARADRSDPDLRRQAPQARHQDRHVHVRARGRERWRGSAAQVNHLLGLCLLLAQDDLVKPGQVPPEEMLLYVTSFFGCVVFTATGWSLFSQGWESYEEKYLEGATRTLDDLFLTIPPQQLM